MPDLVFNELRFLRNPNEHQDEHQPDESQQKPSHQGKKREAEREEISAYFNQCKSHDNVLHSPGSKQQPRHRKPHPKHGEGGHSREGISSPILPDEELTAIPYLGFGSKGTANQSSHPQPSETTYLTWSESVVDPPTRANYVRQHKLAPETLQLSTSKPSQSQPSKRQSHVRSVNDTAKKPIRESLLKAGEGQWAASRRVRGPARVEVYTQRSEDRHDVPAESQDLHDRTSLSLPTRPLAASAHIQQHDDKQKRQIPPSDAESFHTSDILKIRGRLGALADRLPSDSHTVDAPQSNKENVQPISTSPIAKVLRTAHEAISKAHEEPTRQPSTQVNHVYAPVRETAPRTTSHSHALPSHESPPQYPRPRAEGYLTRQPLRPFSPIPEYRFDQREQRNGGLAAMRVSFDPADDEMLDNDVAFQPGLEIAIDAGSDQAFENAFIPRTAHSGTQSITRSHERPSPWARDISWSRNGVPSAFRETTPHATIVDRGSPPRERHLDSVHFEDELEGFWRPNRLY